MQKFKYPTINDEYSKNAEKLKALFTTSENGGLNLFQKERLEILVSRQLLIYNKAHQVYFTAYEQLVFNYYLSYPNSPIETIASTYNTTGYWVSKIINRGLKFTG